MNFLRNIKLDLEEVSIKEIIESTQNNMTIPPDITINYEGENPKITCDSKLLEGLFANLFSNSIHAMKKNGTITVNVYDEHRDVIIKVLDQGPGIPKSNLQKIFQPLFTTKQEGTGLGLFSCKTILDHHGGTIEVQNNPTTFIIKLPKPPKSP